MRLWRAHFTMGALSAALASGCAQAARPTQTQATARMLQVRISPRRASGGLMAAPIEAIPLERMQVLVLVPGQGGGRATSSCRVSSMTSPRSDAATAVARTTRLTAPRGGGASTRLVSETAKAKLRGLVAFASRRLGWGQARGCGAPVGAVAVVGPELAGLGATCQRFSRTTTLWKAWMTPSSHLHAHQRFSVGRWQTQHASWLGNAVESEQGTLA